MEQVFIPPESLDSGFGYMEPDIMEKTVKITNEYFDMRRMSSISSLFASGHIGSTT